MPGIKRITTHTSEELRSCVVLEKTPPGARVVEGKQRRSGERGEDPGIDAGLDPTKVLNARLIGMNIIRSFEKKKRSLDAEIEECNASVAITSREEEMRQRGGRIMREDVAAERLWGPADRGDEGGDGSGGGRRDGDDRDELH